MENRADQGPGVGPPGVGQPRRGAARASARPVCPASLIGNVKLVELMVRDVNSAVGKLAERLTTRGVRLARMILIQAIRNELGSQGLN